MSSNRKKLTNILLLLFAAGVFILIAVKTDWASTWRSVKSAHLGWFIAATCFMLTAHGLRGARWTLLTTPAGYKLNVRRSFYAVMVGYLVNVATSRGGEIARCALTAKSEKAPVELLVGTVVTERIIDLIMLLLFCFATLLLQFNYVFDFFNTYLFEPLSGFFTIQNVVVGLVALLMMFVVYRTIQKRKKQKANEGKGKIGGIITKFSAGLKSVFSLQKPILFIACSVGIWAGYWLSTYCLLQSLDVTQNLTVLNALSVVIFASIGIAIPLPAGAGVWGAVSIGLQSVYGLSIADSETYGIYTLAVSNIQMIVFGAISYALLYFEMQKNDVQVS